MRDEASDATAIKWKTHEQNIPNLNSAPVGNQAPQNPN